MEKPSVFITRKIPENILKPYEDSFRIKMWTEESTPVPRKQLLKEAQASTGLMTMLSDEINDELLQQAPHLKIVANLAVGYDNIDLEAAKRHDVIVTNTPDILTETTADLTFALLLATGRRLIEANEYIKNNKWTDWSPYLLAGKDIYNETIGIVGMGRIGKAVANRARGFNMNILYHNRTRHKQAEHKVNATYVSFTDLLQKSDYVVSLLPLTEETEQIFNRNAFQMMKTSAIFINASRGKVVDEAALYKALQAEEIMAAGLDVFAEEPISASHPLMKLDNVVCLPHIGSASLQTRDAMIRLCLDNIMRILAGRDPLTQVKN